MNYTPLPRDTEPKVLGIFTRDRSFYRTFFPLLLIIALQQLAALLVNMLDNIMLGTYSELALSGATLVNQVQFLLQEVASGVGMGIVVLGSQYWGQQRIEPIKKIVSLGLKFAVTLGLIFFVMSVIMPRQILSLFTNDADVIEEGLRYFRVIRWTYLVFTVSNALMYALQCVETVIVGTVMSLCTIVINFCLNYLFIYGNLGAPEMGIVGAAVATLVSRGVELAIILVYVLFIDRKLRIRLRELLAFDFTYLKDYIRVSLPVLITGVNWGVAQATQTAILGHIGAEVLAASSIAVTVAQFLAVLGLSCVNSSSVVMGKTVGEGRLKMIKPYTKTLQAFFIIIGICLGISIFAVRNTIVDFYSISEETAELARRFLTVMGFCMMGSIYEYPVMSGIIAGGGSTKIPAIVDNVCMWFLTIPTALISAFALKLPPIVTFWCLKADQLYKCIPNSIICNRYRWVRRLTRE